MSDNFKKELSDLVKQLKAKTGLTQEQIAKELRYKRQYLSELMSTKSKVKTTADHIKLFKEVFTAEYVKNLTSRETTGNKKALNRLSQGDDYIDLLKRYNKVLEEKNALQEELNFLKQDNEIHFAKNYALEEFLLEFAAEMRKTDVDTQSVILGKHEGAFYRLGEDIYISQRQNADKLRSEIGKEKVG